MTIPLKWVSGDRCYVRGHVGVVESLGEGCACVQINEWRRIFCGIEELDLVPFHDAPTLPPPPNDDEVTSPGFSLPPSAITASLQYAELAAELASRYALLYEDSRAELQRDIHEELQRAYEAGRLADRLIRVGSDLDEDDDEASEACLGRPASSEQYMPTAAGCK